MTKTRACAIAVKFFLIAATIASGITSTPSPRLQGLATTREGRQVVVHAARKGNPWINLTDGYPLVVTDPGNPHMLGVADQAGTRPLSLAAGDFDEDGVPDLISGYATPGGGLLTLHRGNQDSIYPETPEALQRKSAGQFTDSPFFPPAVLSDLAMAPLFMGVGDFDADGHMDVVVSDGASNQLGWLRGNGKGGVERVDTVQLPGAVTAMATGEMNQLDGWTDLVVAVDGPPGTMVLIFQSSRGALTDEPEILPLGSKANALALGLLDDGTLGMVVASGRELTVVAGRERSRPSAALEPKEVPADLVSRHSLPLPVVSLALGDFIWDPLHGADIAVLLEDGSIQFLEGGRTPSIPGQQIAAQRHEGVRDWHAIEAAALPSPHDAGATSSRRFLLSARVSSLPTDDLVVVDAGNRQVHLVMGNADEWKQRHPAAFVPTESERRMPVSLDMDGQPVAVLPMRLNTDAQSDLVILRNRTPNIAVAFSAATNSFVVNSSDEEDDANPADGICDAYLNTPGSQCTLRAAIEQANANKSATTITFSVAKIIPFSQYPDITVPVTMDGFLADGSRVEIDASAIVALKFMGGKSVVRGMVIHSALQHDIHPPVTAQGLDAITFRTNGGNIAEGNYLGTDVTGTSALPNFGGISVASDNNIVGGTVPAARNVLSGNETSGVTINSSNSNQVVGNFIGTDASGMQPLGNHTNAVLVSYGYYNGVRGPNPSNNVIENNVISGTLKLVSTDPVSSAYADGIFLHEASGTLIRNNLIGTAADGKTAMPNGRHGIWGIGGAALPPSANRIISNTIVFNTGTGVAVASDLEGLPSKLIGPTGFWIESNSILSNGSFGVATGGLGNVVTVVSNTIASNGATGVLVLGKDQCEITQNSIYSNRGLGIDLSQNLPPDGVTPNDPGDPDAGPNNLQNFPVLTLTDSNTKLKGTLNSTAGNSFRVEFFRNASRDPSGYGQGQEYISSIQITTDAQGNATFDAPFSPSPGQVYTATATLLVSGNTGLTSEFSAGAGSGLTLSGTKFEDRNGNGAREPDEPGLAGWTINLSGTATRTTVTDGAGHYTFDLTDPGTYEITETLQSGWTQTMPLKPYQVTAKSGDNISGLDFGNRRMAATGVIRGIVFEDKTNIGVFDKGEPGLPGWVVELNGGLTATTNPRGEFQFPDLQPGTYSVKAKIPTGWVSTTPTRLLVVLTSNQLEQAVIFGNKREATFCTCTPTEAVNKIGTEHKVTVKVMTDLASWIYVGPGPWPAKNVPVKLTITQGPNVGKVMEGYTDSNGEKEFRYKSERGGTDYLEAAGAVGAAGFSCTATKTWSGAIVLSPRLILSCFCKDKPIPIKVTENDENGNEITNDSSISFEWIRPGGLPAKVAQEVLDKLGINAKIAGIDVQTSGSGPPFGTVVFKEAGVNVLEARRKLADGTIIKSNMAFLIGGIKLAEAESLTIEPLTLTSAATDRITDLINSRLKEESQLHAPMVLFPPTPSGSSTCWAPLNYIANKGYVRVKEIKFSFLNDYIKDVDLMEALADVIGLAQEYVPMAWWLKAISMGTPLVISQFLDFKVSHEPYVRGAGEAGTEDAFIRVTNEYNWREGELLKGVVFAKGSGLSAVQATLDLSDYCLGKATDLMAVIVLPDLEKVDIRNEAGRPQEPLVVDVGNTIQPHGVGVFGFLSAPFQVSFDALGETDPTILLKVASALIPGAQLTTLGGQYTVPPGAVLTNGTYEGGDYFLGLRASWQPGSSIVSFDQLQVQIPLWQLFTDWTLKPTPNPYATVTARDAIVTGVRPGLTTLRMDVCIPLLTRRFDENGLRVTGGTIRGNKFLDKNGNGKKDTDEPGLRGWRIELNGGPEFRITDENGNYVFEDLGPAKYTVSEVPQPGWTATTATSNTLQLDGNRIVFVDFGNRPQGSAIMGFKFNDFDRDGILDQGEPLLSGWLIELVNPAKSQTTAADGWYSFDNLIAGTYTVREVLQPGWYATTPASQTVKIDAGTVTFVHFGNTPIAADRGVIFGTKFEDVDGDGIWDTGEPGLAGWTISLTGPVSSTVITDAKGGYRFGDLPPGSYTASESLVAGWTQTTSTSAPISLTGGRQVKVDIGNFRNMRIRGRKFDDRDHNGLQDANEPGMADWIIQLDLHNDGSVDSTAITDIRGEYVFENVGPGNPGSARQFTIREVPQAGWTQTAPTVVKVYPIASGLLVTDADFGNIKAVIIVGSVFEDLNSSAARDAGEAGLAGWTVFVDLNRDGVLNGPNGNGVCVPGVSEPCAATDAIGNYAIGGLAPGVYRVRVVLQSGWKQTSTDPPDLPLNQSGQAMSGINFGFAKLIVGAEIRGQVVYDLDRDGIKEAREPGLPRWTVFLDTNNNGQLDTGEKSAVTDDAGNYVFTALAAGSYIVREVQKTGWKQSFPVASSGAYLITLSSAQKVIDRDFGTYIENPAYFYFPFYQEDATTWTGFALANRSSQPVVGLFTAYGTDGSPLNRPKNPAVFRLDPLGQLARLGQELFGSASVAKQSGWVEVISDSAQVGTLCQFANLSLTKMDGAIAFTQTGKQLYFTRVWNDQWNSTFLSIANPGDQKISLKLTLIDAAISQMTMSGGDKLPALAPSVTRSIAGKGLLYESVGAMFNKTPIYGYVIAEVTDGPGAVGFELISQDNPATVIGLNAQFGATSTQAFSAQLVNGPTWMSLFKFINVSSATRKITMTALNEAGNNIGTCSFSLVAGDQLEAEAGDLFGWGFSTLTVGSVRVVYDGAGVLGDVVFGEPYNYVYQAALPLQATGFAEAIFCQVANGAGYWTGLALYNPNAQAADVTVQVYSPTGVKTGEGRKIMTAGTRLSQLVSELVPSSQGQVGGYVVIISTQPLIAQQLFGDTGANMMSAVPPTIIR